MPPVTLPKRKRGLRTGFTTGACAAGAAKAATRMVVQKTTLYEIETRLPNGDKVTFPLKYTERMGVYATTSIVKDGGDDPDCTHGAELLVTAHITTQPGVELCAGFGVATVTKPGLGLAVGAPAITPIPRRNIVAMVREELAVKKLPGAIITVNVPGGEEMAKETTHVRLGLLGGISILGTTGIVIPYSTAAWKVGIIHEIDMAVLAGLTELVLTTGGQSEAFAMRLYPHLPENAFIRVGDYISAGLKHCLRRGIRRAYLVGMIGKFSKLAMGRLQTHVTGADVSLSFLAAVTQEAGASAALVAATRKANTARQVFELFRDEDFSAVANLLCRKGAMHCRRRIGGALDVHVSLVDFHGGLLGRYPEEKKP